MKPDPREGKEPFLSGPVKIYNKKDVRQRWLHGFHDSPPPLTQFVESQP